MSQHAIYLPDFDGADGPLIVEGDEAHHALRVKRVREGRDVTILNGRGLVATARVVEAKKRLGLEVERVERRGRVRPALDVWAAAPKGPRMSDMVDALSQAGASSWTPLIAERTPADPTGKKLDRLERVAVEAAKQCGRGWLLELGVGRGLDAGLDAPPGAALVAADGSGEPYERSGAASIRSLVGPEGGWTEGELERIRGAGARVCSFGPHVMRIETAAPTATALILAAEGWTLESEIGGDPGGASR